MFGHSTTGLRCKGYRVDKKPIRPNKIRILGIDYSVTYYDQELPGTHAMGLCKNGLCEISISLSSHGHGHEKATLIHEIIEAANYRMELGLKHRQISGIETVLFQVLRDNNLANYLSDG